MDKILDSGTENWLQAVSVQQQVETLLRCNEASAAYGLVLSQADCALLLAERQRVLKQERRVELGRSILPELVRTFCASLTSVRIIMWKRCCDCRKFFLLQK